MKKSALSFTKNRIFFIVGLLVFAVGATMAISHGRSVIDNEMLVARYQTVATDSFTAPRNWQTGETIPKEITLTNNSNVPVSVRIKLEEDWIASDGTTHLPLISAASGLEMAQINFTQNSGWTKRGAYYEYDGDLAPNATTTSLLSGVTLNIDANLDTTDTASPDADGAYANAEYHLIATIQTMQAGALNNMWTLYNEVASQENDLGNYVIDFTKKAISSNNISVANGNGVNKYTENGKDVYYYRGHVDNNNVIWANFCWKIVRTTATGGVKMIYNGLPTAANTCLEGYNAVIGSSVFSDQYTGSNRQSIADSGYMFGDRLEYRDANTYDPSIGGNRIFVFSNGVVRDGDNYTLDTSEGQSITGTWYEKRADASTRYHYICKDGAPQCDSTKIGYLYYFGGSLNYIPIGGYDNIEDALAGMFRNTTSSSIKTYVESWFEEENLDGHVEGWRNYEDDLEDAIFCNDRGIANGSLAGEENPGFYNEQIASQYNAYIRNHEKNASGNLEPSLDCANKNDAFQVSNNDAKLEHKVGLITADELTLAGAGYYVTALYSEDEISYLSACEYYSYSSSSCYSAWSMSPAEWSFNENARNISWRTYPSTSWVHYSFGIRPMVSLKAGTEYESGTGLKTDPYIVP